MKKLGALLTWILSLFSSSIKKEKAIISKIQKELTLVDAWKKVTEDLSLKIAKESDSLPKSLGISKTRWYELTRIVTRAIIRDSTFIVDDIEFLAKNSNNLAEALLMVYIYGKESQEIPKKDIVDALLKQIQK